MAVGTASPMRAYLTPLPFMPELVEALRVHPLIDENLGILGLLRWLNKSTNGVALLNKTFTSLNLAWWAI